MPKPVDEETAIHESAHAVIAMAHGYVPNLVVAEREGFVQFEEDPSDYPALLIAFAGAAACDLFLGVEFEMSESDCRFAANAWKAAMSNGIAWKQEQRIYTAVYSLVATYEPEIICLANGLLDQPRMTRATLGRFVRSRPELEQFKRLPF